MRTLMQCFAAVIDHPRLLGVSTLSGRAGRSAAKFAHGVALTAEAISIAATGVPGIGYSAFVFSMGAHARDEWAGAKVARTFAAAVLAANLGAAGIKHAPIVAVAQPAPVLNSVAK